MASLLSSRLLSARLVRLPPSVRASVFHHATVHRSFSATTQRKASVSDIAIAAPDALLNSLHAVGLPWWAAIPLAAVFVRGIFGYYLVAVPARKRALTQTNLLPIRQAVAEQEMDKIMEASVQKQTQKQNDSSAEARMRRWLYFKVYFTSSLRLGKLFGAPILSWRSFANFGVLLAFMEALRVKCGASEGLLTMLFGPIQGMRKAANTIKTEGPTLSPDEMLAERLAAAREAQRVKDGAVVDSDSFNGSLLDPTGDVTDLAQSVQLSPLNSSGYTAYLDPSMKLEGLSWFPDLTTADPTFTLPTTLSVVIVASTMLRISTNSRLQPDGGKHAASEESVRTQRLESEAQMHSNDDFKAALNAAAKLKASLNKATPGSEAKAEAQSNSLTTGQRLGLCMSIYFFFISINMPAALVLYLIPFSATGWLQQRWLDVRYPLPQPVQRCKRPLRSKIRRQLTEAGP